MSIPRRKETEEALKKSEARYRRIFESTAIDGILILDAETGMVVDVNPFLTNLLGFSREQFIKKKIWELGFFKDVLASQANFLELQQKGSIHYDGLPMETADGRRIDVEFVSNVYEVDNRKMVQCNIRNITERKKAEIALQESEARFRAIFDNSNDGILIADITTRKFLFGNQAICRMLGYTPEDLATLEIKDTCPQKDLPAVIEAFDKHMRREIGIAPNLPVQRKDGSIFYADINSFPLNLEGRTCLVGVFRDITERKRIEQSQRLAQLGKLVADMAHEVNNPLMVISGNAQLCLMEKIENEAVKSGLNIVVEECNRITEIIRNLLKLSRPGKGKREKVDINKSIDKILSVMKHQFSVSDNIEIKTEYAQGIPLVWIDSQQLGEVFMNLLNNSRDAMPKGGIIEITTSYTKDSLKIDFRDTGCGIPEEAKEKLFEPFFTTKEKGTGLGLSICYGIIKAHNGELEFKSEVGKGTTATIILPLGED